MLIQFDQSEPARNTEDDDRDYGAMWGMLASYPTYKGALAINNLRRIPGGNSQAARELREDLLMHLAQQYRESIEAVRATSALNTSTVISHAKQYEISLERGDTVVLVPHSQGNLFANQAHQVVSDTTTGLVQGLGIVAVATPDSHVAGGSNNDFVEHNEDIVTGLVGLNDIFRQNFPGISETFEHLAEDFLGHSFIKSYIEPPHGHESRRLILDLILEKLNTLESSNGMAKPNCPGIVLDPPSGPAAIEATVSNTLKSNIYLEDTESRVTGRLDWKGKYSNGIPTKVLTYHGPRARVIGVGFAPYIFRNGVHAFSAPGPVHGAAITVDSLGREWVVTIVNSEGKLSDDLLTVGGDRTDLVYVRPNTENIDTSGELVSADHPNGWRLIAAFPMESGSDVYSPWFFNGDGREAQTMRLSNRAHVFSTGFPRDVTVLTRKKISLDEIVTASLDNIEYEFGESAAIAVDYLDDEELILRSQHTPFGQLPVWLTLNGEELIPRVERNGELVIEDLDCLGLGLPCRAGGVSFSPNWDGFRTGWTLLDEQDVVPGSILSSVIFNVTYLDLRSKTLLTSRLEAPAYDDITAFEGPVVYRLVHDGEISIRKEFDSTNPLPIHISDEWYIHRSYNEDGTPGGPLIGFYEKHNGFVRNSTNTNGQQTIGPYNDFIISERFNDGSTLNYYSGSPISDLVGTNLEGVTFDLGLK